MTRRWQAVLALDAKELAREIPVHGSTRTGLDGDPDAAADQVAMAMDL